MKINSHFLVYFCDKIVKWHPKGIIGCFFLFLKHLVGSIRLAYFERCLVLLYIKILEEFNFPIAIFPGCSLFSTKPNKPTYEFKL